MTEQWIPKVGDRVRVTGHTCKFGTNFSEWFDGDLGTIERVIGASIAPANMGVRIGMYMYCVHIRNLDPVLEDERKGWPRPPIQEDEIVDIRVKAKGVGVFVGFNPTMLTVSDPRIRRIERRLADRGREARSSK